MKSKIISIIICVFLIASINVIAGNNDDPEIKDILGDAFGYLDIDSVRFYEDENKPELLVNKISANIQ